MAGIGNFTSTKQFSEDLNICDCTGVGFQTNQLYYRDGHRKNEHELEDKSFHYKPDDNIALYGIFDGHNGQEVAEYVTQEMPGQILLGQLSENSTEQEIREVLQQAFLAVERGYFQTVVDPFLAERERILSEVPDEVDSRSYSFSISDQQQLEALNKGITSSSSVLVVLMFYGKLYVANAGDCKAQVCVTDPHYGVTEVIQLSVNHDLRNEDEIRRLESLRINVSRLQGRIGNHETTRCLGNYLVKGGYRENELLKFALSEPVVAEPEITSFPITESTNFLILLSSGLYKALEEVTQEVNRSLAQMIIEEFNAQSSLNGVAQAVVDRIARMHQEVPRVIRREDMTLLVRNFNYALRGGLSRSSPLSDRYVRYSSANSNAYTPTFTSPQDLSGDPDQFFDSESTTETDSSDSLSQIKPNSPEKIKAYVDFSNYYKALETNSEFNESVFSLSD